MLVLAPLLVPLATALLCLIASKSKRVQQSISFVGALALFVCAVTLLLQINAEGRQHVVLGNWPWPFGIEFAADRLSAAMLMLAALMLPITLVWQWRGPDAAPHSPTMLPLLHGLVAGAGAAFVTADLFNLYVWFELSLICALGLLAHGGQLRQLDATLKYFVLNVFGTLLLLAAVALTYGATGQLNFGALGPAAAQVAPAVMRPIFALLLLAILIKAAAFPFFAWLPASYHTLPIPVLALFSALLTKIGIYALLRLFTDVFAPMPALLNAALAWLAIGSMLAGAFGAAYHWDLRRILAFHSISQIGYILLAVALASKSGTAAAIFFALHHSFVKAGLLLTAGLIFHATGYYDLRRIGGLYAARPGLSAMFLLLALSLVGIPPFSGFWGKYLIVKTAIVQGEWFYAAAALGVGMLTLYSMLKIWLEAFWKPHPDATRYTTRTPAAPILATPAGLCVGALIVLTLWIGLFPDTLISYVSSATELMQSGGQP